MITPERAQQLEEQATLREVFDLRVFIVGGGFQYAKMFFDAGLKGARSVDDADIICFTGGADVDPSLYGEKALTCTHFDVARDTYEAGIFGEAVGLKKPMVGICRGGQFLNVMNGGKMWQDVNNHCVRGHKIVDLRTGVELDNMTSTHHQMMRPADDAEIIAVASLATLKKAERETINSATPGENSDMEVLWYPGTLSLCFQPHPEFSHGDCRDYFLDLVDEYIIPAT